MDTKGFLAGESTVYRALRSYIEADLANREPLVYKG